MPTAAILPVRRRSLRQRWLVPWIVFGALLPGACRDRMEPANAVPRAASSAVAKKPSIATEPAEPRSPGWILLQLRGFAVLPSACPIADGSPDALVSAFASRKPEAWRDLGQPRELALVVPSALPLHGIDLVVQTCEVQVDLGAVARVDVTFVRAPQRVAHGHGDLRGPSLHILLPRP